MDKIKNVIKQRHYRGFTPDPLKKAFENKQRKKFIQESGEILRNETDWGRITNVQWGNVLCGFFPGVVMGKEGFVDIANVLSNFIRYFNKKKEEEFKGRKLDFSRVVVHDDIVDIDGSSEEAA